MDAPSRPRMPRAPPEQRTARGAPAAPLQLRVAAGAPWYADGIGWSLVGGGLLAAGGATYLLASASDSLAEANATPIEDRRMELRDTAHDRRRVGAALGIGSACLLVAGVVKLTIHPRAPSRSMAASWSAGVTTHGVFAAGSF